MNHPIYRVKAVKVVAPYTLEVSFDDATVRRINFQNVLSGEMYAPLRDEKLFNQVKVDPEVHTIVFPNGADYDPTILHDWDKYEDEICRRAAQWRAVMPQNS